MIRIKTLTKTCDGFPAQWEGETDDGRAIYVRYRWGRLTIGVGADLHAAVDASMADEGIRFGHEHDGEMGLGSLMALTEGKYEWPV